MSMEDFINTLNDEQRQALLKALTSNIKEDKIEVKDIVQPDAKEDFTMVRQSSLESNNRRIPVKARQNTWSDTGSEAKDVVTPNVSRTPRTRKPPQKKVVRCHACGKENTVNANIVYGEYYRCDRCVGG